jgi:hypothetical protein
VTPNNKEREALTNITHVPKVNIDNEFVQRRGATRDNCVFVNVYVFVYVFVFVYVYLYVFVYVYICVYVFVHVYVYVNVFVVVFV